MRFECLCADGSLVLKEFHNRYSLYAVRPPRNVNSILPRKVRTSLPLLQSSENGISHRTRTWNTEEFRAIARGFTTCLYLSILLRDLKGGAIDDSPMDRISLFHFSFDVSK